MCVYINVKSCSWYKVVVVVVAVDVEKDVETTEFVCRLKARNLQGGFYDVLIVMNLVGVELWHVSSSGRMCVRSCVPALLFRIILAVFLAV